MVNGVLTIESCYGVFYIVSCAMVMQRKKKGSIRMLAFIFLSLNVGNERRGEELFQWKGGHH